ncbi:MAG TPA: Rid family hydrolase [Bdellovibrionales bacterium]|nr:Rid family hydrolase [Bdellovibrionales bacterium]
MKGTSSPFGPRRVTTHPGSLVTACYVVPGLPHVLLAHEQSPAWSSLRKSFDVVRQEIEASDAEMILYFSSQWLSVLGYLFQADPNPEWTLVDHNWHEFGSINYKFKIDSGFAKAYAKEVKGLGHYTREVAYRGFPIDTGSIVAQKLLNPSNRLPAAIASCNMYAEKQETLSIGQAAMRAIEAYGKRVAVVVVSGLSSRFETKDIDPKHDKISSLKDDEWNQKVLEIFGEGRLEDVSEVAREYSRQANADMGFKGIWWLNGLTGKTNDFEGKVFDYQPIWGTGAALVGLYPKRPLRSIPDWVNDEADITERTKAQVKTASRTETPNSKPQTATGLIATDKAPPPVGPYPHARREGEFLFLSGCGPRKPGSKDIPGVTLNAKGEVVAYDVEVQTRSVMENISVILEASGATLNDVIDVQAYLTDMKRDFATFNRVYGEFFGSRKDERGIPIGPCRTTIEVGALPTPIAVELKVVARMQHL